MQFHDYYKELGVQPTDPEATIKQAYRRLARKYHPDVSKEADAEARFKAINEAWEVLRDADRRAEYDNLRAGHRDGQPFRPPPGWQSARHGGFDAGDADNGGFSDFFESLFGDRGRAQAGGGRPRAPRALRATVTLSLDQAYAGGPQRITINDRTYDVRVPAGIATGQTIRLAGQGPGGGDVLLEVAIAPHPRFQLDGRDIVGRAAIAPWQAALGGSVQVDTLGGPLNLTIPAGSQPGRRLRLKGRGMPGPVPGDHYVVLDVRVPAPESDAQRAAYRALADAFGGPPAAAEAD